MVGITRLGVRFPRRRLDRGLIAKAWGSRTAPGSRTVAGVDQDALTMAVDAALACMGDADPAGFDGLYFASTSAPYLEKQVASFVATAIDLPRTPPSPTSAARRAPGSRRCAPPATRVRAGSLRHALVAAADVRVAEPGIRAGGAARRRRRRVAVGTEDVIAELVSAASVAEEFTYFWRTDQQHYVQVADARFGNQYGMARDVPEAVTAALRKAELPPARVAQLCLGVPDARAAADAAKRIGCDPATQLAPSLQAEAGRARDARCRSSCSRAPSRRRRPATSSSSRRTARAPTRWSSAPPTRCPTRRPASLAEWLDGGIDVPVVRALPARARRAARRRRWRDRCRRTSSGRS